MTFTMPKTGRGKGLQRITKKSQYMRRRYQAEQSESQAKNVGNLAEGGSAGVISFFGAVSDFSSMWFIAVSFTSLVTRRESAVRAVA